jgi:hypothetical protein
MKSVKGKTYNPEKFDLNGYWEDERRATVFNRLPYYNTIYEYMLVLYQIMKRAMWTFNDINNGIYTVKAKTNEKIYNLIDLCGFYYKNVLFEITEMDDIIELTDTNENKMSIQVLGLNERYTEVHDFLKNMSNITGADLKAINKLCEYVYEKPYNYEVVPRVLYHNLRYYHSFYLYNKENRTALDIKLNPKGVIVLERRKKGKETMYHYDNIFNEDDTYNENFLKNVRFKRKITRVENIDEKELEKISNMKFNKKELTTFINETTNNTKNISKNIIKLIKGNYK